MYCQRKRFRVNWTRTPHLAVLLLGTLITGLLASAAYGQEAALCPKGKVLRAGVASFSVGDAGIFVTFTPPLPPACLNHVVVVVQQTNDGAYSPTSACTYLNVLKITSTNFQVQHKGCSDGIPYPATSDLEIRWVAITTTQ
jgi:hypothetical protein